MPRSDELTRSRHVRQRNRSRILSEIQAIPGVSRSQLARRTNLTEASVSRITRDLLGEGLVRTAPLPADPTGRGRPNVGLALNPDGLYVLSVCLTAYEQKLSVVGATGERVMENAVTGLPNVSPEAVLAQATAQLAKLRRRPEFRIDRLVGASITVTGDVDTQHGMILDAPSIGWGGYPFGEHAARAFGLPVTMQNVAVALHIAETRANNATDGQNSLLLHAGLGMGASLMIQGSLSHGSEFESGMGNILIGDTTRLMDVASGRAILNRLGRLNERNLSPGGEAGLRLGLPHAVRQANAGEPRAVSAFADAGRALATAFLGAIALAYPERVILAGPIAAAAPFAKAFQQVLEEYGRRGPIAAPEFSISRISYLKATELTGLDRYLIARTR